MIACKVWITYKNGGSSVSAQEEHLRSKADQESMTETKLLAITETGYSG